MFRVFMRVLPVNSQTHTWAQVLSNCPALIISINNMKEKDFSLIFLRPTFPRKTKHIFIHISHEISLCITLLSHVN